MRPSIAFRGLALLASIIPLAVLADQPITYQVEKSWPKGQGKRAPSYHHAECSGVACDGNGRIFVFQRASKAILVFDRDGKFLTSWGKRMFSTPHGCRFDREGNLWLTDLDRQQLMKFTPDGTLLATYGVKGKPGKDAAHFNEPADVAFGPNGDIYVADGYENTRIVRLSHDLQYLGEWGTRGHGPGQFWPAVHSVQCDARGRVWVADRGNHRIQVFDASGNFLFLWPNMGYVNGLFITADQRLLIAEGYSQTVTMYTLDGQLLSRWGGSGRSMGKLYGPHMLCQDTDGSVYVAEISNKRVQRFDPVVTSAGGRR